MSKAVDLQTVSEHGRAVNAYIGMEHWGVEHL